ncbi:uncharacterized protein LOC143118866 isoform X1 [Alosa pseudoharengus]|uniref:uncharacterized protein LOC143118866 isoform X1 n=2 Tax=Alosa pseudoharengus TaxID=34774 RepID=UPI003F8C0C09
MQYQTSLDWPVFVKMQTAVDCVCVEEFVQELVGAEMDLDDKGGLDTPRSVLQDNPSVLYTDQCCNLEESSDADRGFEALCAGLSSQSSAPQLMPSKRNHACWECGERFKTLHDLMVHFDQHQTTGRCHLCKVAFRRGASLAMHLENTHRDVALGCPATHCRAQLRNRWLLNQHIERCHTRKSGRPVVVAVVKEVVVVAEEEPPPRGQQSGLSEKHPQEPVVSDHSYHSTIIMGLTDHTYNSTRMASGRVATRDQGAQEHANMALKMEQGSKGFLEEGAPIQWDEVEEFAEEEVGSGDASTGSRKEYEDCDVKHHNDDQDYSDSNSDSSSISYSDSDSLPPGDSIYDPKECVISNSDSDSDSDLKSDSFSSDSNRSHAKGGKHLSSSGRKKTLSTPITATVVKPLTSNPTAQVSQKCPHCWQGPYLDLKTHIVKCCSKGPDNCIKCWRVYGRFMDYICVACKKTFSGSDACKSHVCPMKFAGRPTVTDPVAKQPVDSAPVFSQLPQLYQIISLLPPGIIYTQAQSIGTSQPSVSPSTSSAVLPGSVAVKAVRPQNTNATTPTSQTATGSSPAASALATVVTIRDRSASVQAPNQTVQSPMLLQPPGRAAPPYAPLANTPTGLVHVYAQNSPKTQVIIRGETPPVTPASSIICGQTPSGAPAPVLVHSQVPGSFPVTTIAHSQALSGKPVTIVCNRDQLQMPSAMIFRNQTPTSVPSFIAAPSQGQPRAPTAVVVRSQVPPGVPAPSAIRNQAPAGTAASSAARGPPGVSTATEGRTQPSFPTLFRIPTTGSNTFFFPMPNQPLGAAGPTAVGHLIPVTASSGAAGVVSAGLPVLSMRFPAPTGVSLSFPSAAQSSRDSGHPVSSQVSTAVPSSAVSISSSVCTTASTSRVVPSQAYVSNALCTQVSSSLPSLSRVSSTAAGTASIPKQAPNVASTTQNPRLPAVSALSAAAPTKSPPLVVLSDSGPLRILFMFLNQSRELDLAQRMKTRWHYKEIFTCRQCGAVSRQPSLVVLHRYRHRGAPRPHRCCGCGRRFQARLHLLRHQVLHAEATRYICAACGDSFEGAQQLVRHKANCRYRTNAQCLRPFVCSCGRRFVRPSALLWHKLNNSRHKPRARNQTTLSRQNQDVQNTLPAT